MSLRIDILLKFSFRKVGYGNCFFLPGRALPALFQVLLVGQGCLADKRVS